MKKILLIYNPLSGDGTFPNYLDLFVKRFQEYYNINLFRLGTINLDKYISQIDIESVDKILVAGGDGTLNSVINVLMKNNVNLPLGILPTGTVNDFANYLNMPDNISKCFDIILKDKQIKIDLGKVNNRYFINVCAGGFLTNIPHQTASRLKNKLGKIAYYLKGVQELPKIKTMPLDFKIGEKEFTEDIFLYLILNSNRAGGYGNLAINASINDGRFELVAIKAGRLYEISNALIDLFINKNLNNNNILYYKNNYFKIESLSSTINDTSDIDGEKGPKYPLEVSVIPEAVNMIVNN